MEIQFLSDKSKGCGLKLKLRYTYTFLPHKEIIIHKKVRS